MQNQARNFIFLRSNNENCVVYLCMFFRWLKSILQFLKRLQIAWMWRLSFHTRAKLAATLKAITSRIWSEIVLIVYEVFVQKSRWFDVKSMKFFGTQISNNAVNFRIPFDMCQKELCDQKKRETERTKWIAKLLPFRMLYIFKFHELRTNNPPRNSLVTSHWRTPIKDDQSHW